MSLYPNPRRALVASVNALNNLNLDPNDYTLSAPEVIENTTGRANTRIVMSAASANSPLEGSIALTYMRLNLADLVLLVGNTVGAFQPTTTLDIALVLNSRYGLNLEAGDIVNTPLTLNNGVGPVTLTAQPGSVSWIGSVTFEVVPGEYPLGQYLTTTRLPGLNYPAPVTSKPYAALYSYWRDFSAQRTALNGVATGNASLAVIRDALVAVTGDPWVLTGANRFSLEGATVTYVGVSTGHPLLNVAYTHGVVVALSDQCLGYTGELVLNFRN